MSLWVVAICERSVGDLSPEELRAGIGPRLAGLTEFFDPEDEEDPAEVFRRLTIRPSDLNRPATCWHLTYRDDHPPIVMDRVSGEECAGYNREELAEGAIRRKRGPVARAIRDLLRRATERFAFCLKTTHLESMGFPIAVGAAAYLVGRAGGVIRSCSTSWLEPDGLGVRVLLEYEE